MFSVTILLFTIKSKLSFPYNRVLKVKGAIVQVQYERTLSHWAYHWNKRSTAAVLKFCSKLFLPWSCASANHDNWCTGTLLNRLIAAQWEGMRDVGSARYEPALLPPCSTIRVLSCSNCQRSTYSISKWIFRNLPLRVNQVIFMFGLDKFKIHLDWSWFCRSCSRVCLVNVLRCTNP